MNRTVSVLSTSHAIRLMVSAALLMLTAGCAQFTASREQVENEESAAYQLSAAESGNAESAYNVAIFYRAGGVGLPKDLEKARHWFVRAAELGAVNAQCRLGADYLKGELFEKDAKLARYWFERCAESDEPESYFYLGRMHDDYGAAPLDTQRATYYYIRGVEREDPMSMSALGDMYASGRIFPKDNAKAIQLWEQAVKGGVSSAAYKLGRTYRDGKGVAVDEIEALKWFRIAAKESHAFSKYAADALELQLSVDQTAKAKTLEAEWLAQWAKKE